MRTTTSALDDSISTARRVRLENELHRRGAKLTRSGGELVGPCLVCGGRDRFSVHLNKQVWHCRHCSVGGGIVDLVMHLDVVEFADAIVRLNGNPPPPSSEFSESARSAGRDNNDDNGTIRAALKRWWDHAKQIEGTLGITYLEQRGIFDLPPDVHDVLRFHSHCVFGKDTSGKWVLHPCILALFRDVITDEPTGIHRIALTPDGKLIGRMALGRKQGSAVKLWPDAAIATGLVIGEGIESVLSAATRVNCRGTLLQPAWSLIDKGNLEDFSILAGVEHLTILADADQDQGGQEAARTAAKRWAEAGRTAEVLIPDVIGEDFNDIAKRRSA